MPKHCAPLAVPLVACDPYFSIWSPADKLTDTATTHWTGKPQRLTSLVRIDGHPFRVMGADPAAVPALPQTSVEVLPTRTICTFNGQGIQLTMTFMTADLPDSIDLLSRPVTYLTYECRATDGHQHKIETSFDAGSELAVNTPDQQVTWSAAKMAGLTALKIGSVEQSILGRKGDDVRIDWGYFYLAAENSQKPDAIQSDAATVRSGFIARGNLSHVPQAAAPLPASGGPVSAISFRFGAVGAKPVSRWLMLAYDDLYSIQYMQKNLRPYWRRNGWQAADLLKAAAKDYESLKSRCAAFDAELMADLHRRRRR